MPLPPLLDTFPDLLRLDEELEHALTVDQALCVDNVLVRQQCAQVKAEFLAVLERAERQARADGYAAG